MIIGLVHVIIVIVTVMFILNFVHCEITACDSDNKQSLILSYQVQITAVSVLHVNVFHAPFGTTGRNFVIPMQKVAYSVRSI